MTEAEIDVGIAYLQRLWLDWSRASGVAEVAHLFAVSAADEVADAARPGIVFYLDMNAFMVVETGREDVPDIVSEWVGPLGATVVASESALRRFFVHALPRMRSLRDRDAEPDLA